MLKYNGSILKVNNGQSIIGSVTLSPLYPSDMDFIYLANNFDGSKIPNVITTSDMGPYLKSGNITKNGSGSSCYLSNGLVYSNFLYIDLTTTRLNAMKASNSTYTYFIRVYAPSNGTGGIACFRNTDSNYKYMIRVGSNKVEVHGTAGTLTLSLDPNKVFKITINGANAVVNDLEGTTQTVNITTTREMGSRMTTFLAGVNNSVYANEGKLDRFYGIAGIARATTDAEDRLIKAYLMSQGV